MSKFSRFWEWKDDTVLGQILWYAFWICVIASPFLFIVWEGVNKKAVTADWEMQSITRGSSIHGSFFLGTGSIDQNMYYISYIRSKDGGTYLKAFPASCSVVYEGTDNPYVEFKEEYSILREWFDIKPPSVHPSVYRDRMSCSQCNCTGTEYILHVPTGTVIKEFRLQ